MTDLDTASDSGLVVAIARWQEPALAEVYRRHGGAVHAVARRVVGSPDAAEDIVQEVFVRLWEKPDRFDADRGSLRSFLLAVAHSRAVDYVRSQSARRVREDRDANQIAAGSYDIEHHAWDLYVAEKVRTAVKVLPETERQAIELAYFGGNTYREVADMLSAPEGTVKARIRSGLTRLRGALEREGVQV